MLAISLEVQRILTEAHALAREAGHPLGSLHLLLAFFSHVNQPNQAHSVLVDRGIKLDEILAKLRRRPAEPQNSIGLAIEKSRDMARMTNSSIVNSLHLLLALTRVADSAALRILRNNVEDLNAFRTELFDLIQNFPERLMPARPDRQGNGAGAASDQIPAQPGAQDAAGGDSQSSTAPPGDGVGNPSPPAERDGSSLSRESVRQRPQSVTRTLAPASAEVTEEHVALFREQQRPRSRFELDPEQYPYLCEFGRNLTLAAERGVLDPLVGRSKEIQDLRTVLGKKRSNNPCLIGRPGVGKTVIVEGFALEIVKGNIEERVVIQLDATSLDAGTELRGSFADRMRGIREEVAAAKGQVVVFADEIHRLLKSGGGDGGVDAGNDLKEALARGTFPCIGATTDSEYRRYIASDQALERRFQAIRVPEPDPDEALEILLGIRGFYERHYDDISYSDEVLEMIVRAAHRYVTDRALPDSAINLMDMAGSTCRIGNTKAVTEAHVAEVLASHLSIPVERVVVNERRRLLEMEDALAGRIVGHADNLRRIAEAVRRNYAGFSSHRPMASFLLIGPAGVGKKEVSRAIADFLFGSEDDLTILKMGEYAEKHDATKLLGAPPSYVGYEEGGLLARLMLKRPYQLIVFEDIDKAHPHIQELVAQILDSGAVNDSQGRRLDFSNTMLVATTDLGTDLLKNTGRARMGFGGSDRAADSCGEGVRDEVLKASSAALQTDLSEAFDERLVFPALREDDLVTVTDRLLVRLQAVIERQQGLRFTVSEEVLKDFVASSSRGRSNPMTYLGRELRKRVESALAAWVLETGPGGARSGLPRLEIRLVDERVVAVEVPDEPK